MAAARPFGPAPTMTASRSIRIPLKRRLVSPQLGDGLQFQVQPVSLLERNVGGVRGVLSRGSYGDQKAATVRAAHSEARMLMVMMLQYVPAVPATRNDSRLVPSYRKPARS